MGLFSFIGKAVKAVAGTALSIIPGGGVVKTALNIAGKLLAAKQPMQTTPLKYSVATQYSAPMIRAAAPRVPPISVFRRAGGTGYAPPPAILRASPVMPGGAVATSQGIMASGGGIPPASYGGSGGGTRRKKKRKSTAARRSSSKRTKRKSGGRKLKFGSPAWRKKYMKKRR